MAYDALKQIARSLAGPGLNPFMSDTQNFGQAIAGPGMYNFARNRSQNGGFPTAGMGAQPALNVWNESGQPWDENRDRGSWWSGQPGKFVGVPTVTPLASKALNQLLMNSLQGLQNPNGPMGGLEQRTMRQYFEDILPKIAERNTALGGALSSPSYTAELGQSGANLAEKLQERRMDDILRQLQIGLTPQFEVGYHDPQSGFGGQAAKWGGDLAGNVAAAYLTGGSTLPGWLISLFAKAKK